MRANKAEPRKAINIKIPSSLYNTLEALAIEQNRTITNTVETILLRATENPIES